MNIWIPLLSALAGGVIGSITSIVVMIVQSRATARREMLQAAMMLALEDRKIQIANARPGTPIFPPSLYVAQAVATLKLIEKGEYTPETFKKLQGEASAMALAAIDSDEEWRAANNKHFEEQKSKA